MWFFKKNKALPHGVIDDIKKEDIDMQALFSNIGNRAKCEQLYKELAKKIHPDKFVENEEKSLQAHELFSDLQAHRNEYEYMLILELKINDFLKKN